MANNETHKEARFALDPFFAEIFDGEWNACIGQQGDEENYADGYMEAAMELVAAVIDKQQFAKRDTLAMPILYNARHAVELMLKFVIERLFASGILAEQARKNHDIQGHWQVLEAAPHGDSDFRKAVSELKPFVDSLHAIDEDGQQLRYAETQDGEKSLADKSICNLTHIRKSLDALSSALASLKYRAIELADERRTGTFTAELSRRDLYRVAKMLPPRNDWDSSEFASAREAVMAQFGIGSRRFACAADLILKHREMGGSLGIEFELTHLTDDHAKLVLVEWMKIHPPRNETEPRDFDFFDRDWARFDALREVRSEAHNVVIEALTTDEVADLQTIYYLGRDGSHGFCEDYEARLQTCLKVLARRKVSEALYDLMSKTNLATSMVQAIRMLGRNRLADELQALAETALV